jgi:hypothetical protein
MLMYFAEYTEGYLASLFRVQFVELEDCWVLKIARSTWNIHSGPMNTPRFSKQQTS